MNLQEIIKSNIELKTTQRRLQAMQSHPFINRKKIKKLQALEEAQRDILNTNITQAQSTSQSIDKNNYATYSSQVSQSYLMYRGRTDYGSEFYRGILETRVSFICGEGLSISSENESTRDYIKRFLAANKLQGSKLIKLCELTELEGKALLILEPNTDKKAVIVSPFSWWENQYTVHKSGDDFDKAVYREKESQKERTIGKDKAVYVRTGGSYYDINEATNRLHCVLTQIENASRASYDLRNNSHLFGKTTPYWKTATQRAADSINNAIQSKDWEIGTGYAGEAEYSYVEPSGGAANQLMSDLLTSLRAISTTTGIPLHWLSYPDLMSNRATAENMLEVIAAATRKERLLWEEGLKETIEKSMEIAIDKGFERNNILGDFEVKLPLISVTMVEALSKVFLPLQQAGVIHMDTLRNKIPGVDPLVEKALEEAQEKENMEKFREQSEQNRLLRRIQDEQNTDNENRTQQRGA